jgi:hypothetical protein
MFLRRLAALDLDLLLEVHEAGASQLLRQAAQRLCTQWPGLPHPEQRRALTSVRLAVIVAPDQIQVSLERRALTAWLLRDSDQVFNPPPRGEEDWLTETVEASLIRVGGEVRVIHADHPRTDTSAQQALLQSIAQGRVWHSELLAGESTSLAQIGARHGVSQTHVQRTLRCAWLAPFLVEALIAGDALQKLTLARVRANCPLSWEHQRRLFVS